MKITTWATHDGLKSQDLCHSTSTIFPYVDPWTKMNSEPGSRSPYESCEIPDMKQVHSITFCHDTYVTAAIPRLQRVRSREAFLRNSSHNLEPSPKVAWDPIEHLRTQPVLHCGPDTDFEQAIRRSIDPLDSSRLKIGDTEFRMPVFLTSEDYAHVSFLAADPSLSTRLIKLSERDIR